MKLPSKRVSLGRKARYIESTTEMRRSSPPPPLLGKERAIEQVRDDQIPESNNLDREFTSVWQRYCDLADRGRMAGHEDALSQPFAMRMQLEADVRELARRLQVGAEPGFLIALLDSAVEVVARFSRANPERQGAYSVLAAELLWRGLKNCRSETPRCQDIEK